MSFRKGAVEDLKYKFTLTSEHVMYCVITQSRNKSDLSKQSNSTRMGWPVSSYSWVQRVSKNEIVQNFYKGKIVISKNNEIHIEFSNN